MTITFTLLKTPESELYCYAYSTAACKALGGHAACRSRCVTYTEIAKANSSFAVV
jgi:hypothetical protein